MLGFSSMKNKVRTVRVAMGLTQEELAEALQVSRQTIISIERVQYNPSTKLSLKIARYFGKKVEDLFELEESDLGPDIRNSDSSCRDYSNHKDEE